MKTVRGERVGKGEEGEGSENGAGSGESIFTIIISFLRG